MNKSQLAITLSKLKTFEKPVARLEQYPTDPEIAAEILWFAFMNNDIKGKIIADLGCGAGILGIGALLLGAKQVFFIDIDPTALNLTKQNLNSLKPMNSKRIRGPKNFSNFLGLQNAVLIKSEIQDFKKKVDTVIQNPPFGIQTPHADKPFLEKAFQLANTIYSIHTQQSQNFIRQITPANFTLRHILNLNLPIKQTQKFHKKPIHRIPVALFVFSRNL